MANLMRTMLALLSGMFLFGCAHTVEYDLTDADRASGQKINQLVEVKKFADAIPKRTSDTVVIGGETWRINPQRGYTGGDIAYSVSSMVARHLDHSGLFRGTIYKGGFDEDSIPTGAPLILTGTVAEYSVMGRVNRGAELKETASGFFGLTGMAVRAVANIDEETEWRVKITLKNIQLKQARTGQILWRDTLSLSRRCVGADYEAAGTQAVYNHVDACLKDLVSEMVRRMDKKIAPRPTKRHSVSAQ